MLFLKELFEKVDFEKKYPACKELSTDTAATKKMIIVLTIYCFTNQTKVFTLQTFFKTQTTGNSIDFELMRVKSTDL